MIWILCAAITVVLIATSIRSYLDKKLGSLRVILMLLLLFAATYVLYLPAFLACYDTLSALMGNVIHTFQVITIDADVMEYHGVIREGISIPFVANLYTVLLGVLHVALPAVSAVTAITVLFRCFSALQLFAANNSRKPMFVFSEINERSVHLAHSLKNIRCDIVFAGSTEESSLKENEGRLGWVFKEENIEELRLKLKKGKEIYLFCISDDEELALSQALRLTEQLRVLPEDEQAHLHIYLFTKASDCTVFVDSAAKGSLDIQCVNEYEMLIYNLLDRYPLYGDGEKRLHLLLHGLSRVNMAALKAVAWCGQLNGYEMKISVVGMGLDESVSELKMTAPGLFSGRYDIRIYDRANESEVLEAIEEHCADADYIIVSDGSDNETMNRGILLRRLFYKLDGSFSKCPPIFCYIEDPAKFNIVGELATAESNPKRKMSYDLIPFGSLAEVYTYENLVDSDLEKLAKNVHLAYEEIFSDGPVDVSEALKRYGVFEVNKRSNRANALHIRYKLNLLGLDYVRSEPGTSRQSVDLRSYFTEDSLEHLAISEHDRWMAFLESEGWTQATGEQVNAYRGSGISKGRHNCALMKMHPYICDYTQLKALSMELEGKDTTVYDKELILRIPDILGDKWNAAGRKYQIVVKDK